ncbi:hemolysin family protein [Haladaptatus sp. DYF46]|uniref:CNNM domain-containing protein n=1 Tax=Haladaptatus sp. DYF46 TaxID=2886041 RepID=UPI001E3695DA|nr:hemolysin family protein [Haladaptatus sp. DYF46]
MVDISTIGRLTAGLILLLGNGYFVTIEFAMTRVRQFTQEEFQGSRGLERAWEMTERLEIFLSGCQLGITICSVGLGVVAEPALAAVVNPLITALGIGGFLGSGGGGHTALAAITSLAIINLLHLTVGEQAPTYLGIERSKQVAKYGAPILYWWTRIFSPIIRLADWTAKALLSLFGVEMTRSWAEEEIEEGADTRQGLINQMGSTMANMDIPADRREEIINAVAIDHIHASDLMIDRDAIITVSTEESFERNLETIRSHPHTRFPLIGESMDDIIGTIYLHAVVQSQQALEQEESNLADIASPALTVAPDIPISDLIDTFQEADQEIALVIDNGRTVGAITATDAFEAIAGELEDPLNGSQ